MQGILDELEAKVAFLGEYRFRMELHCDQWKLSVGDRHHHFILAFGQDLKDRWKLVRYGIKRMIPSGFELARDSFEQRVITMSYQRSLTMDRLRKHA
jgi:hypothetical protein